MGEHPGNTRTIGHFMAGNVVAMFLLENSPNVAELAIIDAVTRPEPCCALLIIRRHGDARRNDTYSMFTCADRMAVPKHVRDNARMLQVYDRKTGEGLTPGALRVRLTNTNTRDGFHMPDADQYEAAE